MAAIADMLNMLMYSARKKQANRIPEYSVWNPPTSSCSASTRSKGARLVSAIIEMKKMTKDGMSGMMCQAGRIPPKVPAWAATISRIERVPE